jgi:hypothetical protein
MFEIHNKSGKRSLSISYASSEQIETWRSDLEQALRNSGRKVTGLIKDSPCLLLCAEDGRLSHQQIKVCYGYQLVAYLKFGQAIMYNIPAKKRNSDDLLISHTCGTRNCCNPSHMVIERKKTNDECTACHQVMRNMFNHSGWSAVLFLQQHGGCPHDPLCGNCSFDEEVDLQEIFDSELYGLV